MNLAATNQFCAKNCHLTVLVQDVDGIISRVAGMFTRRGYNLVSLVSANTETAGINRITIVVDANELVIEGEFDAYVRSDLRQGDRWPDRVSRCARRRKPRCRACDRAAGKSGGTAPRIPRRSS